MVVILLNQIHFTRSFPIQTVRVFGIDHLNQSDIQDRVLPLVSHGFFSTSVEGIRDRLLQMPWVSDITVRRHWPDEVEITVVEKNAIARWNAASLLSAGGELFNPPADSYPLKLAQFTGPDGQQIVMLGYFNEMNRILLPLHARISSLALTPYFTWKLTLDNGIALQIGHKDILTRLTHFVKVYPKIIGKRVTDVEYVDLRYPNGMAVRWKTSTKT